MGESHDKVSMQKKYEHLQRTAWKDMKDKPYEALPASTQYAISEAYDQVVKVEREKKEALEKGARLAREAAKEKADANAAAEAAKSGAGTDSKSSPPADQTGNAAGAVGGGSSGDTVPTGADAQVPANAGPSSPNPNPVGPSSTVSPTQGNVNGAKV